MFSLQGPLLSGFYFVQYPVILIILAAVAGNWLHLHLDTTIANLLKKFKLFQTKDADQEIIKLELVRIGTGFVILYRAYMVFAYFPFMLASGQQLAASATIAVLGLFLTIGLATPIASFGLLFMNSVWIEPTLGVWNLADIILQMLLVIFAFLPAGTRLSFDSFLLNRAGFGGRISCAYYAFSGRPTRDRAALVKAATFFSYGLISLSSAINHILYGPWVNGTANGFVFTNSYFSIYNAFFRDSFEAFPIFYSGLFILSSYLIVSWQFLFIPLVLCRGWARRYAVLMGEIFFAGSAFLLYLHSLPWFEFLLWAALFWDKSFLNCEARNKLDVLYDDSCNLCDRTVRFIRMIDIFKIVRFRPLSVNQSLLKEHGIPYNEATTDLYGLDLTRGNRRYVGYDFYLELTRRTFLLSPLWPVLLIGKWVAVGPRIYKIIAARRTKWFGICSLNRRVQSTTGNQKLPNETGASRALLGAFSASCIFFVPIFAVRTALLLPALAPITLKYIPAALQNYYRVPLLSVTDMVGMSPINVFNAYDLPEGRSFFTATAVMPDGSTHLIPIFGPDGGRLPWMRSDYVFYGTLLSWNRRHTSGELGCLEIEADAQMMGRIATWATQTFGQPDHFYYDFYAYKTLWSPLDIVLSSRSTWDIQKGCHVVVDSQGHIISKE